MRRSPCLVACATALWLIVPATQAQQPAADYSAVVDANSRFALKIARMRAPRLVSNEIISPLALSSGFALLRNGANPQCADDIAGTFEFGQIPEDNTNRAYAALLSGLLSRPAEQRSAPGTSHKNVTSPPNGLFLANAFWNLSPANFSNGFRDVNELFYHAEVVNLRRGQGAVSAINGWAKDKSFGRMSQVVTSVGKDDFLFTSLLYFRAYWRDPFLTSATHQADFSLLSGAKKPVQMMKKSGHYLYDRTPEFEAIVLPYSDGRTLHIFLPDKTSSLREFEATLSDENWNKWTEAMTKREGTIELPRFRISAQVDVQTLLTELGAGCAFASTTAFTKAVPTAGAKLTHAEQSLSLAADELGSEAVVFTGVGGVVGGIPAGIPGYQPPPPFHMIVDRPFLAAIVDGRTRAMVLISSIVEP